MEAGADRNTREDFPADSCNRRQFAPQRIEAEEAMLCATYPEREIVTLIAIVATSVKPPTMRRSGSLERRSLQGSQSRPQIKRETWRPTVSLNRLLDEGIGRALPPQKTSDRRRSRRAERIDGEPNKRRRRDDPPSPRSSSSPCFSLAGEAEGEEAEGAVAEREREGRERATRKKGDQRGGE